MILTMTTLAAMMGALPIALGLGTSAELPQPLGLAVVGGLLLSQAVALFITERFRSDVVALLALGMLLLIGEAGTALGLVLGTLWRMRRPAVPLPVYRFGGVEQAALVVAPGAFVALTMVLEPTGWLRYESSGLSAEPAQHAIYADFDGQIALIGYDLQARGWQPGDVLRQASPISRFGSGAAKFSKRMSLRWCTSLSTAISGSSVMP